MPYITKKNDDTFRAEYQKNVGNVTDLGHFFGVISHHKFYWEMETWALLIDSMFQGVVTDLIERILMAIVKALYDRQAQLRYNVGVDEGNQVIGKVDEVLSWATTTINNGIENMRTRIQNDLINPLEAKANQIKANLDQAQSNINDISSKVNEALASVNTMQGKITSFDGSVKSFQTRIDGFTTKISSLESNAQALADGIKYTNSLLTQTQAKIADIDKRLRALEQKPITIFPDLFK